jgi:raffinose/stachyose/melibiose transport system permease protein
VLLFVTPAVVLFGALYVYPILTALSYGFFSWRGIARESFAGLENFRSLLTLQPYADQLGAAITNNTVFFVGTMVLQNGLGLLLALALHRTIRGRRVFQTIFSTPYLMSSLIIGYIWSLILVPTHYGPVNALLTAVGLESWSHPWLGDPATIMPVIILINSWQWCGCPMLIFGAALAGLPEEQMEAARLDGASYWQIVRGIQLPQMVPSVMIVTVLTFIGSFNVFDLIYAVGGTSGGPGGAADVLGTLFYRISFGNSLNSIGLSGAMSVLMLLIVLVCTVVIYRVFGMLQRRYS